jgi:CHAD domain-containing protein
MTSSKKESSVLRRRRDLVRAAKGIRRDANPKDFHAARVATRRLRSALRVLAEADDAKARARAAEIRRLGRRLGRVRDLDVLLARVEAFAAGGRPESSGDLAEFSKKLRSRRADARRRVVRAIESKDFDRLKKKLRRLAHEVDRSTGSTVTTLGRSLVLARARRLLALGTDPATASEDELHRYRIRVKAFRYTLELSTVGSSLARRLLGEATRVQEQLGLLNDAVVAEAMLKEFVEEHPRYRSSATLHALAAACREDQTRARAGLPEPLTTFQSVLAAFVAEREGEAAPVGPGLASARPSGAAHRRADAV